MAHGLHHVTAIAGAARRNLDFHTRTLGQRLVKRTVNFDDPGTYHLYYGNADAEPGSILTFFPWEHVAPGRPGVGETSETAFRVPLGSLGYWTARLAATGVIVEASTRFGETALRFRDPDGMGLALIEVAGAEGEPAWAGADIPHEHAVRGLHGVTLALADAAPTGAILTDVMGLQPAGQEGAILRFVSPDATLGRVVDLQVTPGLPHGRQGGGSVHHIAFRAADDEAQAAMVRKLRGDHGLVTTEQKDRNYFRSVYMREPGGVIFEIATDVPGFAVDEAKADLGQALKLPAELERYRPRIEAALPELV